MDYFHWKLDEPGNRQGIVVAYNETEAIEKVLLWLGDTDRSPETIILNWLSSDATDVFEIDEL